MKLTGGGLTELSHLTRRFSVRPMVPGDAGDILTLCAGNPIYYQYHPPMASRESVLEDLAALPPGKGPEDKFYLGFFAGETLAAVMDLILGYPDGSTAYIGFFMVDRAFQGRGTGSALIGDCGEALARAGYRRLRLAVDRGNPQSAHFWTKNGFVRTGEEYPNGFSAYLPMEKSLG